MEVLSSQTQELLRTGVNLTSFEAIIAELVENCNLKYALIQQKYFIFTVFQLSTQVPRPSQ